MEFGSGRVVLGSVESEPEPRTQIQGGGGGGGGKKKSAVCMYVGMCGYVCVNGGEERRIGTVGRGRGCGDVEERWEGRKGEGRG